MAHIFPASAEYVASSRYTAEKYRQDYEESIRDSAGFWKRIAERLDDIATALRKPDP